MSDSVIVGLSAKFEQCVEAIINGDLETLQLLVSQHPQLIHARSTREHHSTLLFYVTANGVENERQKTPDNIVEITRYLLEQGADPNASSDAYGGASTVLDLLVSSAHPAHAGKHGDLIKLLCEYGADPNANDNSALKTAIAFRYHTAIDALMAAGATVDHVVCAAVVGDLPQVRAFIQQGIQPFTTAFGVQYDEPKSILEFACIAASMMGHRDMVAYLLTQDIDVNAKRSAEEGTALHEACIDGHVDVVEWLLRSGADVASQDKYGFTPLHLAAWHQRHRVMDVLLAHNAPLEALNTYGGTVLTATIHAIIHAHYPLTQVEVTLKKLLDAGADVQAVQPFPTGQQAVDEVLKAYRD